MGYNSKKILIVGFFNASIKQASFIYVNGLKLILESLGYSVDILDKNRIQYEQFDEHIIPVNKINNQFDDYFGYKKISGNIRSGKYSLILMYGLSSYQSIRISIDSKRLGFKVGAITTEWRSIKDEDLNIRTALRDIDQFVRICIINKKLDCNIVCSTYLQKYYSDLNHCYRVPTLSRTTKINDIVAAKVISDPIKLVYIGMPSASKENLALFIRALVESRLIDAVKLDLYGITQSEFSTIFKSERISFAEFKNIHFLGFRPQKEIRDKLSMYDYSILFRENNRTNNAGFPTKLGESLVAGVPVLATDVGDVKLYVKNGFNGYLLPLEYESLVDWMQTDIIYNRPSVERGALSWQKHITSVDNLEELFV